ncbi:MAG: lipoprotein signal peptidase [Flavobacteriia bacterium]|nr:MAG: lipoprotein signal peptidase [Flavobacteriia bacterium]
MKKAILLIFFILLIDQISKFYIKTHFVLSEEIRVFGLDWFRIHFLENNGMAWGKEFGGESGKLFLTVFRLVAIVGIGYWLYSVTQKKVSRLLVISVAMIFAGALGNIIDSVFYGVIFDDSYRHVATFLPPEGGYSSLFHGKVVDMIYFPIIDTNLPEWIPEIKFTLPQWLPVIGGKFFSFFTERHFTFFDPVFNIADSSISIGVAILVLFNKRVFPKE